MLHGGDIYRNQVKEDYSVNLNPLGVPDAVRQALRDAVNECMQYPDNKQEELSEAIAAYEKVEKSMLVCGNGASELFAVIVHAIRPDKVVIPTPSFYGYEHTAKMVNSEMLFYPLKQELDYAWDEGILSVLTEEIDLLYLANPNNPTGKLISLPLLEKILEHCKKNQIYVVLDECFLPFCKEEESYQDFFTSHRYDNLLRVRAFTKIFAIPGVRLGYLITTDALLRERIAMQLPEWNVSVFAQKAGIEAAKEAAFCEETKKMIHSEREWMTAELEKLGVRVYKSQTNFVLFHERESLYEELLKEGILIRDCSNMRGLKKGDYRIAIKKREENEFLLQVMRGKYTPYNQEQKCRKESAIEFVLPAEIEKRSFAILSAELAKKGIVIPKEEEAITKRVIHTSADFSYADTMCYSKNAVEIAKQLIREGADIVTDTNMALSGINKKVLASYGGKVHCFMADEDVAKLAKERSVTRAAVSMEKAAKLQKPLIIAIGNAPTALIELHRMFKEGTFCPAFLIGVPVGFVNVVQAKELFLDTDVPYIINRGRKGGSNVAAAICNAILYQLRR